MELNKNMPVKDCSDNGKKGYKWGDNGKCYTYTDESSKKTAYDNALRQGAAIKTNENMTQLAEELDKAGYKPFIFTSNDIGIAKISEGTILMSDMIKDTVTHGDTTVDYTIVDVIAAVGDRFYGNMYVPADTLRASAKMWDSTYNDISHLGTAYPAGMSAVENIEYITGYNSDAYYDESVNAVRVKMHINHNAPKYQVWKSFIDINKDANRIPNVSIYGFYKAKSMKRNILPGTVVVPEIIKNSDYIVAMSDIIPVAITTCLRGRCDEKAGCGISIGYIEDTLPSCECKTTNNCVSQIDLEKIEYLKKRVQKLGK